MAPRADFRANRQAILDAARSALAEDSRASIETIATAAGLSRRTLYGHFTDRDELIRELIVTGAQRFNAIAEDIHDDDARLALARLASALWNEAAHVQFAAALALDEAHVAQTAKALAPLRQSVAALVARGQGDGSFRTDITAARLARLIEEVSRTVVSRTDAALPDSADVVVRTLLSIVGLSWREADELLAAHPDLLEGKTA